MVSTGSRLNDDWVQLRSQGAVTLVTYDVKRAMWVQFQASRDGYRVATANGSPTAKSLTWRPAYPPNAGNGTTTIGWPTSSKRVITSAYTENGRPMRQTGVCTKK